MTENQARALASEIELFILEVTKPLGLDREDDMNTAREGLVSALRLAFRTESEHAAKVDAIIRGGGK